MIPDKIYIDIIDMDSGYMMAPSFENNGGTEYIRKDAILEWAKESLLECEASNDEADYGRIDAYKKLIDKLNSL